MKTEVLNNKRFSSLTDKEIVLEINKGNIECFSEIIRRYNQRLYRVAVSYGIPNDDCDEVIQLSYISAYEKIKQFRGEAKFSTWLTKILINECLMLKRKNKKFSFIEPDSVTIATDDHQNPEKHFMNKEQKEILEKAVASLPDKYRTAYILKEIEGMSIKDISEIVLISPVNVKVRIHRAKSLLKNYIKEITDVSSLFTFGNQRCNAINIKVMEYIRKRELTRVFIKE